MAKYLDPKADLTFKKIFGEHKNLVISLLNALLPLKDDERVESIEYWPAEKIPDRTEAEKYSIVDVCCKDNKKREFIVEMQMTWTESFKKRVLLNASKAYVAQTQKSMAYKSLQPVYALNFVNAIFLDGVDDYYHYYHLVHDKYTDQVIDGLHLIFVELPKFKPTTFSEKKEGTRGIDNFTGRRLQVLWLRFLTEIDEYTKEVPAELLENEEVNEALEIVEIAAFNDEEMRAYDKFWDRVRSQRTYEEEIEETIRRRVLKKAEERVKEAEAKAEQAEAKVEQAEAKVEQAEAKVEQAVAKVEQAEAKVEQQKTDTARKMKAKGYAVEDIAEIAGLTIEQIEAL